MGFWSIIQLMIYKLASLPSSWNQSCDQVSMFCPGKASLSGNSHFSILGIDCEELLELIGYVLANTLNKYISWLNGLWLNTYSSRPTLPVYLAPQWLQCHVPQWPVHMRWMRIWSCLWRGHWKGCPASSPDHLSHWYFQQCHTCQKYFKIMIQTELNHIRGTEISF